MEDGGHQNVRSWQQSDTWCFSVEQFQTGLFPALSFQKQPRLSLVFPLLLLPFFESDVTCCFHFSTTT